MSEMAFFIDLRQKATIVAEHDPFHADMIKTADEGIKLEREIFHETDGKKKKAAIVRIAELAEYGRGLYFSVFGYPWRDGHKTAMTAGAQMR